MKKIIFFLMWLPVVAAAQLTTASPALSPKPPVTYTPGLFGADLWTVDGKISDYENAKKTMSVNPAAVVVLRRSERKMYTALGFSIAALGGALVGLISKDRPTKIGGLGVAAVGSVVSGVLMFGSGLNNARAVEVYNK